MCLACCPEERDLSSVIPPKLEALPSCPERELRAPYLPKPRASPLILRSKRADGEESVVARRDTAAAGSVAKSCHIIAINCNNNTNQICGIEVRMPRGDGCVPSSLNCAVMLEECRENKGKMLVYL